MTLPPAVVIHGLPHARAALALRRPVTLLSGPDAALYGGCGWWWSLVAAARAEYADAPDILDCGAAPGRALEALGIGCKLLILQAGPAFADVADRAARTGAHVLPDRPVALDLAGRGASRRLAGWLGQP